MPANARELGMRRERYPARSGIAIIVREEATHTPGETNGPGLLGSIGPFLHACGDYHPTPYILA